MAVMVRCPCIPCDLAPLARVPLRFAKGTIELIGYDYWMQRLSEHPRYSASLDSGFRRNDVGSRGNDVGDRPRRSRGATRREVEPVLLPGGVSDEEVEEDALYWRLFVAVTLPRRAIRVLDSMARSMRAVSYGGMQRRRPSRGAVAYDAVRWTAPENMHITLKFLGDVHQDDLPLLKEELDEVAGDSARLMLELGSNGCFPGERTPRILWTGMDGDLRRMSSLATRLDGAMVRCGFPAERREFQPHVTVGRVRSGTQQRVLAAIGQRWLEARASGGGNDVGVPVERMVLMRSRLHHNRPTRYERLYEVGLG
ncbi:MAG: RNA 2',3'-cyclic phosphodiesterase [Chloroflexi bacterium]|nr:RNA 2',3'-cyclic phosphodiesterase [Chloroflexota bacterium]